MEERFQYEPADQYTASSSAWRTRQGFFPNRLAPFRSDLLSSDWPRRWPPEVREVEISVVKQVFHCWDDLTVYYPEFRPKGYQPPTTGWQRGRQWFRIEWPYVVQCWDEQEVLTFLNQFPLAPVPVS